MTSITQTLVLPQFWGMFVMLVVRKRRNSGKNWQKAFGFMKHVHTNFLLFFLMDWNIPMAMLSNLSITMGTMFLVCVSPSIDILFELIKQSSLQQKSKTFWCTTMEVQFTHMPGFNYSFHTSTFHCGWKPIHLIFKKIQFCFLLTCSIISKMF